MSIVIVKCAPDRDLYLRWSSEIDAPIWIGTRDELAQHLRYEYGRAGERNSLAGIERADEHGSSDRAIRFAWWEDEDLWIGEGSPPHPDGAHGFWVIARDRLGAYADALVAEDEAAAWALLRFEADDD